MISKWTIVFPGRLPGRLIAYENGFRKDVIELAREPDVPIINAVSALKEKVCLLELKQHKAHMFSDQINCRLT